ncbi:MFS transporter [Effusibacillus dendaii]|uniref:Putative MFS-type transporter YitG n=1 Tax=Effusibacillus dendaii TaxID=2743772 RepID=A0A7I8D7I4_9BACL|nr:MFS transporter [Effusibacillus dendaii]BCJ85352.1 putative MFS-type transporter YitG [Effusibacillus dendaii]
MEQTASNGKKLSLLPLIALGSVPLIMVLGNSMLIPILTTMQEELNISKFQASLVITLFSVPAGIIIPLAGFLSDRFNRKTVIIPSLILYALGGLIAGVAAWLLDKPFGVIMAGRVLQGIGAAGTAPIAMALAGDIFKGAARSQALGLIEASNGLGKVLSPILGVLVAFIVWYAAFFAFPVLCIPAALAIWFFIKEPKKKSEPQSIKQYVSSLKSIFEKEWKWLMTAYFTGASALFILFGVLFYLSQILEEQYKIDGLPKGGILAIPLLAMSSTSYITGAKIKKRKGLMKSLIVTGMLLVAVPLGLAAIIKNTYILLALLVISGIGTGLVLPCLNMLITSAVNMEKRGIVTSFYGSVRFLGVAIGPPVFTWLMEISRAVMFFSVAGLALVAAGLSMWLIRVPDSEKKPPAPTPGSIPHETMRNILAKKKARA